MLFLGLDGGGSKTTALVCDETGAVQACAVGGSINYYGVGMPRARENLQKIMQTLKQKNGIDSYAAAFIGMSALNTRATKAELCRFADGILTAEKLEMDSDLYIALQALSQTGPACVIVSGTGSMAAARLADGRLSTSGGWGHLLGDEGSGYAIALAGIQAGVRALQGSAPATGLAQAVLGQYGTASLDGLVELFYDPPMEKSRIAAFAAQVCTLAGQGDSAAANIVNEQASLLANTAQVLLRQLPQNTPVGLWGGLFEHHKNYRELFAGLLQKAGGAAAALLPCPPQMGALFAALSLQNIPVTPQLRDTVLRTAGTCR